MYCTCIYQILVEEGAADLDAENNADANALYWPAYFGRVQVVEYLIQKGILYLQ